MFLRLESGGRLQLETRGRLRLESSVDAPVMRAESPFHFGPPRRKDPHDDNDEAEALLVLMGLAIR